MKRRDFILSTVAGAGIVSASAYYFLSDVEFDATLAQPQSLSSIWNTQTINAIGNQYRKNTPDESGARTLAKLLTATFNDTKPTGNTLNEIIINDFVTGKTVVVDGWVLSITEARQCALASTIQSQ